jgi:hypothetical protein
VERLVPVGPWPLSTVGGWPLVIVAALGIPLLLRALHRVQALQAVGSRPPLGR